MSTEAVPQRLNGGLLKQKATSVALRDADVVIPDSRGGAPAPSAQTRTGRKRGNALNMSLRNTLTQKRTSGFLTGGCQGERQFIK